MKQTDTLAALVTGAEALAEIMDRDGRRPEAATLRDWLEAARRQAADLARREEALRQTRQSLEKSAACFEQFFAALPSPSVIVDQFGLIDRANAAAAELFGFRSAVQLSGHSLLRLVARGDHARLARGLQNRGEEAVRFDAVRILTGELTRQAEVRISQVQPLAGVTGQRLVTLLDRTDLYSARQYGRILHSIVDSLQIGVAAFDRSGYCTFANAHIARGLSTSESGLIGKRRNAWMTGEQALLEQKKDAVVLMTEKASFEEESVAGGDGDTRYLQRHKVPLYDERDRCIGVGEMITDVTQLRAKEHQLSLAYAAYSVSREGMLVTDSANRIVSVNAAFERITGYTEQEVLGRDPGMFASGRHDEAFFREMWQTLKRENTWEGEVWNRRKNGEIFPEWLKIHRVQDASGDKVNYVAVFDDITKRKQAEEEIKQLAFYDILTGLPNRYLLKDRVQQAIHSAARNSTSCALAFFDLDHFKQVNDSHGHQCGDALLQQVALRVKDLIRGEDTLSRLGGDEFVLLFNEVDVDKVQPRLQRILDAINTPYTVGNKQLSVSASFGVAFYPNDGKDFDMLLKHADTAMYSAKDQGRGAVCFFNSNMANRTRARGRMEDGLRSAIANQELSLVFQPQVSLDQQRLIGCEALLRWNSASMGAVSPSDFIPIAESTGLIAGIGEWVIRQGFEFAASLQTCQAAPRLAINLSATQLRAVNFTQILERALRDTGVDPSRIEFEITESQIMQEAKSALALLERIKAMGFAISIDDFGTGYSSLAYLNWMPVDKLKIDRAFVQKVAEDEKNAKVCLSIINLANSLGIRTIAEGVETAHQYEFLQAAGCYGIQGYYIDRPMSRELILTRLRNSCDWHQGETTTDCRIAS